jgi:hypothetical protein
MLKQIGPGPIRGLFRASDETGYCVSGNQWIKIEDDFTPTLLGPINTNSGPVSMADNGSMLVLGDGSEKGYQTTLGQSDFGEINDPTGSFTGTTHWAYIDTYLLWAIPDSVFFGSTLSDQLAFDTSFFAGKVSYPDNLKSLFINRREIFLLGDVKSEVWYNSGGTSQTPFAFSQLPGTYIENGIAAPYSIASHDITVFWLSRNLQGEGVVLSFRGYFASRISNHALEDAIRKMQKTVGISDALGFTYQLDGHLFYMLVFPRGNQTWVYDATQPDPTAAWHQECWTHPTRGTLDRSRINCMSFINGKLVAGDWENNTIYELDMDRYTDQVIADKETNTFEECPIVCVRAFPHIGAARMAGGQGLTEIDGRRIQFAAFRADMECGMGPVDSNGRPAQVSLRWSDDRGRTFGNALLQTTGMPGEYLTQPQWLGMGVARDRIFELSHNIAGPAALNGAWVDAEVLGT